MEILNQLAQPVLAFFTIGLVIATIFLWRSTRRYADFTERMSKTMEGQKDISERQTGIMEEQSKIMASQAEVSNEEARWIRFLWLGEQYFNVIEDLQKSDHEKNATMLLMEAGLIKMRKYLEYESSHIGRKFLNVPDLKDKEIISELLSKGYTMETINRAIDMALEMQSKKQSGEGDNAT
jgi:hypothetical protein